MIREAESSDLPELMRMGLAFTASIHQPLDPEIFVNTLENMMDNDDAFLVITEGGTASGLVYASYLDGNLMAQELWWWVDEDKRANGIGGALLSAFETWAASKGANRILLTATHDSTDIGPFYISHGYQPQEHIYMKDI